MNRAAEIPGFIIARGYNLQIVSMSLFISGGISA